MGVAPGGTGGDMSPPIILPNYRPWPEKFGPLRMISWKKWTSTVEARPENVDLDAWFSEKKMDLNLKMWTFYAWFSEKSGPRPEYVDLLRVIFWKKWTSTWKCGPFTYDFLKKVDLDLKMWTFYAWFSEKRGPRPENVGILRVIFWKRWTSTWKCGPFTHDFLKKVDLNLKNVDLLRMIIWKKVDLDLKMWTFYAWFS